MDTNWHKMNSLVCDAEKVGVQIADLMVHSSFNKNTCLKNKLSELREKKLRLFDKIHDLATAMLEKLNEEG